MMRVLLRKIATVAPKNADVADFADAPLRRCYELRKSSKSLVRPFTKPVFEALQSGAESPARFVFEGPTGAGKSTALLQTAAHAREQGFTVISVPSAYAFANSGAFVVPAENSRFAQTDFAQTFVKRLRDLLGEAWANAALPQKVTVTRKRAGEDISVTVESYGALLELGAQYREAAVTAVERTLVSLAAEKNVVFCVDGVQSLQQNTIFRDAQSKVLHAQQLVLPFALWNVISSPSVNAIAAVDSRPPVDNNGKKTFEVLKMLSQTGMQKVEVGMWSLDETKAWVRMVREENVKVPLDDDAKITRMHYLAGGSPRELGKVVGVEDWF